MGNIIWTKSIVVGFTTTCTCAINAYHHQSGEFEPRSLRGVLDTTLCDIVCRWLATGRWFSPGTPVSSTNMLQWISSFRKNPYTNIKHRCYSQKFGIYRSCIKPSIRVQCHYKNPIREIWAQNTDLQIQILCTPFILIFFSRYNKTRGTFLLKLATFFQVVNGWISVLYL